MDILAALNDANPQRGKNRCKIQRFLDSIDDETPGKGDLSAAVAADPQAFPAKHLTMTFSALGTPISAELISDHRNQRCLCYR